MFTKQTMMAAALLAAAAFVPTAYADDWRDEEDGVLYLTSVDSLADEYFIVQRINDEDDPDDDPDWKIEITYYRISATDYEVDIADYDAEDIHRIDFEGDNNTDGFYNYTELPSVAYGHGASDYLIGGDGPDDLYGGLGDDVLDGEGGDDDLYGERGRDILLGGPDDDFLNPGSDQQEGFLDGEGGYDIGVMYYSQSRGFSRVYQQFDGFECESVQQRWTIFFSLTYFYW
ncbi:MAG: hypothetical protein AAFU85_26585 [Planctomycetota bacterium]